MARRTRQAVEGYWQGLVVEATPVPYVAARTYGDPDDCSPSEGGYCEDGCITELDDPDGFIEFLRDDYLPSLSLNALQLKDFSTLDKLLSHIEDAYQTDIEAQVNQDMD